MLTSSFVFSAGEGGAGVLCSPTEVGRRPQDCYLKAGKERRRKGSPLLD